MNDWLQMIDTEAARAIQVAFAAVVAFKLAIERGILSRLLRRRLGQAKVRHIVWFAQELGIDPCDLLRLHPAMRGLCEDRERVEAERTAQLLKVVEVDLAVAS